MPRAGIAGRQQTAELRAAFPRRISPPQRQDQLVQLCPQGLVIGHGRGIGRAGVEAAEGRREAFEAALDSRVRVTGIISTRER